MENKNELMEVMNEGAVGEEVITSNGSAIKNIVIGLGVTGAVVGLGFAIYKVVKNHKAKKAEIVEAEVEEIEE